ncbi:MAG: phytanoyl-CoA dioxygenase family protein [Capsulimonadales bacterium]|nr:phytanoyl-CoA dioxygenase family protein [Capsulimonadales bacterium]
MTEREKYLFDVQGILLVRNFLTPEEVARLNDAIDANADRMTETEGTYLGNSTTLKGTAQRGILHGMLEWEKPWCEPFRELLAHPKALPYLDTMLGRGWRLDHAPVLFYASEGTEGLKLHGPGHNFDSAQYYVHKNGIMRCGMVSYQFQLADIGPGDGGFCYVPGSHKANYPCPASVLECDADEDCVLHVPCKAGDLLIFNEATTHGTLPWKATHQRRTLMYRFSPKTVHFAGGYYRPEFPDWVNELTEAQRAVLEPPYIYRRPLIEPDGVTVVRPHREFP